MYTYFLYFSRIVVCMHTKYGCGFEVSCFEPKPETRNPKLETL